eukprot:16429932-Heterocapsa_arctica.AAC.1
MHLHHVHGVCRYYCPCRPSHRPSLVVLRKPWRCRRRWRRSVYAGVLTGEGHRRRALDAEDERSRC